MFWVCQWMLKRLLGGKASKVNLLLKVLKLKRCAALYLLPWNPLPVSWFYGTFLCATSLGFGFLAGRERSSSVFFVRVKRVLLHLLHLCLSCCSGELQEPSKTAIARAITEQDQLVCAMAFELCLAAYARKHFARNLTCTSVCTTLRASSSPHTCAWADKGVTCFQASTWI